jgi:hypothetical protein
VAIGGDNHGSVVTNWSSGGERLAEAILDVAALEAHLDLERYTGRDWIVAALDDFTGRNRSGYFVLEGEAGVGKTAFAAHLSRQRELVSHFVDVPGGEVPAVARKNLAAQLIARFGLPERLGSDGNLPATAGTRAFLSNLLNELSRRRAAEPASDPLIIVVDALDQSAPEGPGDVTTPIGLPGLLPPGIFVLVTARVGLDYSGVREPSTFYRLEEDDARNLSDMQAFLGGVGVSSQLGPAAPPELEQRLMSRCKGNWMHLRYLLAEIEAGARSTQDLDGLPRSLTQYYLAQVSAWCEPDAPFASLILPTLALLAALRRPAPPAFLTDALRPADPDRLQTLLDGPLRPFLMCEERDGVVAYSIRHAGFREFLTGTNVSGRNERERRTLSENALRAEQAHRRLCECLLPPEAPSGRRDWDALEAGFAREYRMLHLADHAAEAGVLDDITRDAAFVLTTDPHSLLRQANSPRIGLDAKQAVGAFRRALNEFDRWEGRSDRAWLLHTAAMIAGAHELADSAFGLSDVPWRLSRVWGDRLSSLSFEFPALPDRSRVSSWLHSVVTVPGYAGAFFARRDGSVRYLSGRWKDAARVAFDPHAACTLGSAVLSSGAGLAVGCFDGSVVVMHLAEGRAVLVGRHDARVLSVALGQIGGRDVVVSGAQDGKVMIHGVAARDRAVVDAHANWVTKVQLVELSDSEAVVLSVGSDGVLHRTAFCVDERGVTGTGAEVAWRRPVESDAAQLGDDPFDHTVTWTSGDGEEHAVNRPPTDARSLFALLPCTPGGERVVVGGASGTLALVDLGTGAVVTSFPGHSSAVTDVCIVRVGGVEVLASGSLDGSVRLWDLAAGDCRAVLKEHFGYVNQLAFGAVDDQDVLFSCGSDGTATTWYLDNIEADRDAWSPTHALALGSWGGEQAVFAGCADASICVLSRAEGGQLARLEGHEDAVTSLDTAELDGVSVVVSGVSSGEVLLWKGGGSHQTLTSRGDGNDRTGVLTVGIGENDGAPAVGVHSGGGRLNDQVTLSLIGLDGHVTVDAVGSLGRARTAALGRSRMLVAPVRHGQELMAWRPGEPNTSSHSLGHERDLTVVGFAEAGEGARVLTGDSAGVVISSDLEFRESQPLMTIPDSVRSLAVARDAPDVLVAVGRDAVHVRDASGDIRTLPAHYSTSDVVVAPDGTVIYSCGIGPSVIEWVYEPDGSAR